jgi:hypothetical protein
MKHPSRYLNDYLRKTTPKQAVIKKWAHAATLAFAALIVPSLCAIYFRAAGLKENEAHWVWASVTMWKIHGAVAIVAVLLWIFEKPRLTKYEPVPSYDIEENDEEAPNQPSQPTPTSRRG